MTTAPAIDRRTWFTGFAIAITIALVAGLIASTDIPNIAVSLVSGSSRLSLNTACTKSPSVVKR